MAEARIHTEAPGVTRIDHEWGGPGFIASYLVEDGGELALVEAGPASTLDALLAGIRAAGYDPADLAHVLLTHIHLDHAAAAGQLARIAPNAAVHVHPLGAPHLADPSRLLASAARLYGERMQELWGTMLPVPAGRIRTPEDGGVVRVGGRSLVALVALETPGHAAHHFAFHDPDAGLVFTGDVGGIRLERAPHVRPPTPPPELDTPAWLASISRLRALEPRMLLPTHFGGIDDVAWHLDDLEARLRDWTRLAAAADPAAFAADLQRRGDAELLAATGDAELVRRYAESIPYDMMAAGLLRQARTRAAAAAG
jgi:glyoxylase-like metal-dependent hydrolase (beta-lactamase superfamily II)